MSGALGSIQHFVVLMFENRSFDHLLGYAALDNPQIDGLATARSNRQDPSNPNTPEVATTRAAAYAMPYDPNHEFADVAKQLYAPGTAADPITMGGFVVSAMEIAASFADGARVMEGFQADQIPVLTAFARSFAVCNAWHSSLPGPTWPNRFFVHAATSGGLSGSPGTAEILRGFAFPNGTIYERLQSAGLDWRIYHDGLPQSVGLDWLRPHYLNPFGSRFCDMGDFAADVADGDLPAYTFIEPCYDTGSNYRNGNSMHPMNDIRQGEALLKAVYETLRNSALWPATMLIVTFDEHGGFFDHVPPPAAAATGDDSRYAGAGQPFVFDRLGVRVPGLVASAYTAPGTVISPLGAAHPVVFDHTSILRTVEQRFGLAPLTGRDAAANSLEAALNLDVPRTDAPARLPDPVSDIAALALRTPATPPKVPPRAPLSANQKSLIDLALKCSLDLTAPAFHEGLMKEHAAVRTQGQAARYLARHDRVMAAHHRPRSRSRR